MNTVITAELKSELQTKLRGWRISSGYSLTELGDLTGLSASLLSRVERGERNLRVLNKVRMARRLGVRVSDLFEIEAVDDEDS